MLKRQAKHLDLNGRVALVTGGARGIGYRTGVGLARRGAAVALVDLDQAAADDAAARLNAEIGASSGEEARSGSAAGARAVGIAADVTDSDAINAAVERTVSEFGRLDVCVANAGIAPQGGTKRALAPDAFERVIEVNLLGVGRTVRAAMPHIIENKGHFLLVSSVYAFVNGAFVTPYACAKAGVEALGRALRVELSIHDVTVGVAYFGYVDTEMVRQGFREDELGSKMQKFVPGWLRKRIVPEQAGEAIAEGVEACRPRVIEPRRWKAMFALRGVLGPFTDRYMSNNDKLSPLIREADSPDRRRGDEITDTSRREPEAGAPEAGAPEPR